MRGDSSRDRALSGSRSRRLIFAFAPPADTWPSALLRGRQLMEIIEALRGDIECRPAGLADLWQLRHEWVVLTKSALHACDRAGIDRLRGLGHRLIADFVDLPVDTDMAASMEMLLASSFSQLRFFRGRFPRVATMHLTHHVDLRIPSVSPPTDRARFGYFGKPWNCRHAQEIADLVRIVDTKVHDTRWMACLPESNAHYAIRGDEPPRMFKPFLKGFVAAHCGVPMVVDAADEEARHYLGADYPLAIGDLSLASVRRHMQLFAEQYATPIWGSTVERARAVAAQSRRAHVEDELRAVLAAIW
jgi:hypothetical protein